MDRLAHAASLIRRHPRLANLPLAIPGASHTIKAILGVAQQRRLPQFARAASERMARATVERCFEGHDFSRAENTGKKKGALAREGSVLLWPTRGTTTTSAILHASPGPASRRFRHRSPRHHVCCGRPLYDFGFLQQLAPISARFWSVCSAIDSGLPLCLP